LRGKQVRGACSSDTQRGRTQKPAAMVVDSIDPLDPVHDEPSNVIMLGDKARASRLLTASAPTDGVNTSVPSHRWVSVDALVPSLFFEFSKIVWNA
jgi:hypothetical protein